MRGLLSSLLDNDSRFGRAMTRLGIIIGANLMFVLFSMPVVTIGAGITALYHVMFKTLRGDGELNPFKEFWAGFKSNFRQSTIAWIVILALALIGNIDLQICRQAGGVVGMLRYPIYAMGVVLLILALYLFPAIAAFEDTLPHLIRDGFFFAMRKPWKVPVIVFFDVFPLILTYTDQQMLPLYAFLWTLCGFGLLGMLGASLLLPEYKPFLPAVDVCGDPIPEEASEEELLEDMRKLGM